MPMIPAPEEVLTIAPPPCLSIRVISYFMHRNTPRRSMLMIRSHATPSTSAVGTNFFGSTPALLKATSSRPKASTVLSRAALTSSPRVTSHVTASARPPCSSIMRAVSWLPCSDTSATTTLAPSRANASAAARPMPLAAPVTNATFPVKSALPCVSIRLLLRGLFRNLWVVKWVASWTQQRLDRATLIHHAVTLRHLLERQRQVEDLAGIDLTLPHEVDQLGQVAAHGGRATVEVDVREEQLLSGDLDAMRNTDVAHVSARVGGPDRLHHRLLRADTLQHGVGAESVGQLLDTGDARVTPLGDDVGRAELACEFRSGRVTAHRDDPPGAHLLRGEDREKTHRAVADDHGRHARLDVGGVRGKPARAHDVRERQQARDEVVRRKPWGGDQGAVRERDAQPPRLRTTDELATDAGRLVSCAADRAGVVRRKERADDELAWLDRFDRAADLLNDPAVLVAERCRLGQRLDAAVGPEVGPAHARGRHPDDRIRRLRDPRLFALLETHVARCIQNGSSHALSLLERHFTSSIVTLMAPGISKASTPRLIVPRTTIPGSGIG